MQFQQQYKNTCDLKINQKKSIKIWSRAKPNQLQNYNKRQFLEAKKVKIFQIIYTIFDKVLDTLSSSSSHVVW